MHASTAAARSPASPLATAAPNAPRDLDPHRRPRLIFGIPNEFVYGLAGILLFIP